MIIIDLVQMMLKNNENCRIDGEKEREIVKEKKIERVAGINWKGGRK